MSRNKYLLSLPLVALLVWVIQTEGWQLIQSAHAQGADTAAESVMNTLTYVAGLLITAMNLMMWVLFHLLEIVLDPYFIFDLSTNGQDGPLMMMLHEIWQLMRDLMNIIFAVLLVVGAIITIVKANMETVKQYRVKFILAVVLVNFSWFVPRVIIDVSQIMTYTIYQIPSLLPAATVTCKITVTDSTGQTATKPCMIITKVLFLEDTKQAGAAALDNNSPGWICPLKDLVCYQQAAFNQNVSTWDHKNIISGLIVNHARLSILAQVNNPAAAGAPDPNKSEVRELITFLMRLVLVLVIHIALFFPMLALVVALFIRIPILWITMAFMPLAFLGFVIGDKMGDLDTTKKIWSRFLGAAFLPALAAIPLAIGFVMVNAGVNTTIPTGFNTKFGSLPLLAGVKDIWQLMWMFIAIFIMWAELFPILKKDELIGKFTAPIEQYGQGLGKFALKAPLAAPIIPGPGGGMSPLQFLKAANPARLNALIDNDSKLDSKDIPQLLGMSDPGVARRGKEIVKKDVNVKTNVKNIVNNNQNLKLDTKQDAQKLIDDLGNKLRENKDIRDNTELNNLKNEALVRDVLADETIVDSASLEKIKKALETLSK